MGKIGAKQVVKIADLKPYERNARTHSAEQVEQIAASIKEFGFISPVLIDEANNVIAGHGRLMAAAKLGMQGVPCLRIDGLTEEQRKAYILADNRLTELGGWDEELVRMELENLAAFDFDVDVTGFEINADLGSWFDTRERNDTSRQEGNDEYNAFLDKFEQPKTTDDCYTPDNIYDIIAGYVCEKFGKKREQFVRPFYPNGDYKNEKYPSGCVVVDNPPFSILAEIIDFYVEQDQPFFLFCPALVALNYTTRKKVAAICAYIGITYENGANVTTSFITNLMDERVAAITDPALYKQLEAANDENEKAMHKQLPKYDYPQEVITAAKMGWLSKYGQRLEIMRKSCTMIRSLDAMKADGKGIYGGGLLLSTKAAAERAAAERAAAERAAAHRYKLSERELEMVARLDAAEAR